MNEQAFINAYIKLLNDSFNEAINKNIVLQAQLEVSKKDAEKVDELEERVKQLTIESYDNSGLVDKLKEVESRFSDEIDGLRKQVIAKSIQAETFKKEVISCRDTIKQLMDKLQNVKSRKNKKPAVETATENVVEDAAEAKIEDSSSDTF